MSELLVVYSKVKEAVKKLNVNTASDFPAGLSKKVDEVIKVAVSRAKANGRKTVRNCDL